MIIQKFVVGELQANCYLVSDEISNACLIIDPGDEANLISENILRQDLDPKSIVATHGHFDHIMASGELQMAFDIPFYIHPDEKKILNYMTDSAQHWLNRKVIEKLPAEIKYIKNEDKIKMINYELQIVHTPGHSPGGICIVNHKDKIIFTGDTLFKNGVGRTDFSYGSPGKMHQSLQKIKTEFSGYTAYPGHGEKFVI